MGWKICQWLLALTFICSAQDKRFSVSIIPFNGQTGGVCFEEVAGGNRVCLRAQSSISGDFDLFLPALTGAPGDCLGWVSSNTLGSLSCGGGSGGITSLNGQTGATQSFAKADDTNVGLTISSSGGTHTFTVNWLSTLSKARQHANTVYNDQANSYNGGGLQDFTNVELTVPSSAGYNPAVSGRIGFNTTTATYEAGLAGVNKHLILSPTTTTPSNFAAYLDNAGRELGAGMPGSVNAVANSIATRDANGGTFMRDKGEQVYNVKAYGAVGDGVTNDTSAIAATITACQDSARGGTIYVPAGIYGISSGLVHGNGSSVGGASTKAVCKFKAAGAGDHSVGTGSANVDIAVIKWIGANPGSLTYMLTFDGPIFGTGIEGLKFDAASNPNVVGWDLRQVNFSHFKDSHVANTGGGPGGGAFAIKVWPQMNFSHFACYNTFDNIRVRVASGSVGSALWVGGNSTYGTACSLHLIGGYFNRDNEYISGTNTATYGVLLDSSDNFHAVFTHFSGTVSGGTRNGCSIGAAVGAYSGAGAGVYPDSAHFYGISSAGMCGATGSSSNPRPFVVIGGECGADGQGSCDYHNAFTGGGTKPIALSGEADMSLKGIKALYIRNGDAGALFHEIRSTTGTELYTLKRGGVTGAGIEINAFNEIQFKNPSFTEGQFKIRPSASSSPGTCNSTNEGWIWVKAATSGIATALTMCTANSSGVFDWRAVQTF